MPPLDSAVELDMEGVLVSTYDARSALLSARKGSFLGVRTRGFSQSSLSARKPKTGICAVQHRRRQPSASSAPSSAPSQGESAHFCIHPSRTLLLRPSCAPGYFSASIWCVLALTRKAETRTEIRDFAVGYRKGLLPGDLVSMLPVRSNGAA